MPQMKITRLILQESGFRKRVVRTPVSGMRPRMPHSYCHNPTLASKLVKEKPRPVFELEVFQDKNGEGPETGGKRSVKNAKLAASRERKSTRLNSSHSQISYTPHFF